MELLNLGEMTGGGESDMECTMFVGYFVDSVDIWVWSN